MKQSKEISKLLINKDTSLQSALKIIEQGEERICFLIDENNRLIHTVSDGDIRRALIRGLNLKDKVSKMKLRKPTTIKKGLNLSEIKKKFNSRVNIIPEIDNEGVITGLFKQKNINNFLDIKSKDVLIIGLGYVGLTLALVLADNGYVVHGYDHDKELRNKIKKKIPPFYEKGMQDLLDTQVGQNFKIVDNIKNLDPDIYIISVGTPFDFKKKKPNISYFQKSIERISKNLKVNDLVILRSTVPVGVSRNIAKTILEKNSNLKVGENLFLAYCPERTAEGQAIHELTNLPQIVGGFCEKSTELASRFFNEYTHTIIDVNDLESSEMCKLLDNTYRDTIFAYSNQMALLSEKIGLNLSQLIDKVNIGYERNKIPKPSPGVGGPCLTKDPYILNYNFKKAGLRADVSMSARKINELMVYSIVKKVKRFLKNTNKNIKTSKIFILGLSFKGNPETSDTRGSSSIDLIEIFKKKEKCKNIFLHDPIIKDKEKNHLGYKIIDLEKGFSKADVAIFMTNHNFYKDLKIVRLISQMSKPSLVFDTWQIFDSSKIQSYSHINYTSIGQDLN